MKNKFFRVSVFAFIFLSNTLAFQNCSKMSSAGSKGTDGSSFTPNATPGQTPGQTPGTSNSVEKDERLFLSNTTGYGFDPSAADNNYISKDFNETIRQAQQAGLDGIRLNVAWGNFEQSTNVFEKDKLNKALAYLESVGFRKNAVVYEARLSWRSSLCNNDFRCNSAVPDDDKVYTYPGKEENEYSFQIQCGGASCVQPSFASKKMVEHQKNVLRAVAEATVGRSVAYIALGGGITEEYFMPITTVDNTRYPGDYGPAFKKLYRKTFGSDMPKVSFENMFSTEASKNSHKLMSFVLTNNFKELKAGSKEGNPNVQFWVYPADFMTEQGHALQIQGDLVDLMAISDGVYHTDGGNVSQQQVDFYRKFSAQDAIAATYNEQKRTGLEFDFEDLCKTEILQDNSCRGGFSNSLFEETADNFFYRGGNIIHFAMRGTTDHIDQINDSIQKIKRKWIVNKEKSINRTSLNNINISYQNLVFWKASFHDSWKSNGGLSSPINIKLNNDYPKLQNIQLD